MEDYTILESYLEKSFMSEIYMVMDKKGIIKCLKKIPQYQSTSEIEILKTLTHPNIVTFYTSFLIEGSEYNTYNCLVQEFVHGTTMDNYIFENWHKTIPIYSILSQLCQAIHYMHQQQVYHLDLRPSNIMLTGEPVCLTLLDFGLSKRQTNTSEQAIDLKFTSDFGQTTHYPPELIEEGIYGTFTDIWGIGCIICSLITGKPPFYSPKEQKWQLPSTMIESPTTTLLLKILSPEYRERPLITEIQAFIQQWTVLGPQ